MKGGEQVKNKGTWLVVIGLILSLVFIRQFQISEMKDRGRIAIEFFEKEGVEDYDKYLMAINLSDPVRVITLKKGTRVAQYQTSNAPQGNYYAPEKSTPETLGVNPEAIDPKTGMKEPRKKRVYILTINTQVLQSQASGTYDTWSVEGQRIKVRGTGIQYFSTCKSCFKLEKPTTYEGALWWSILPPEVAMVMQ